VAGVGVPSTYTIAFSSGTLKYVANHYGFEWTAPDLFGRDVGQQASSFFAGGTEPDWDTVVECCLSCF